MYSYFQKSRCFWNRYNVAWSFRRESSSDRTVLTKGYQVKDVTVTSCSERAGERNTTELILPFLFGYKFVLLVFAACTVQSRAELKVDRTNDFGFTRLPSRVQEEMIPLLTTCCCGTVSVRTASLLVAAMLIFGSGVHLFVNILDASGAVRTIYWRRGSIDFMIINIVSIVLNILLIAGIEKRKLALMKPATIFYLVVPAFLFGLMCAGYLGAAWYSAASSVILVVMGLLIAIFYYFWLIVYSCYRQLKNELLPSSVREEEDNPLAVVTYPSPK